jgi:periplasmic protein TonB
VDAVSPVARTRAALAISAVVHVGVLLAAVVVSRPATRAIAKPLVLRLLPNPSAAGPEAGFTLANARPAGGMLPGVPVRVLAAPAASGAAPAHPPALATPLARAVGAETVHTLADPRVAPAGASPPAATGAPGEVAAALAVQGPAGAGAAGAGDARGGGSLLGELHRRLAEAAVRCYPGPALRLRLQGVVPVRFCLDSRGAASALSLVGTSGSELLDRSALECVVPGAEPLSGLPGCFEVPVRFGG